MECFLSLQHDEDRLRSTMSLQDFCMYMVSRTVRKPQQCLSNSSSSVLPGTKDLRRVHERATY